MFVVAEQGGGTFKLTRHHRRGKVQIHLDACSVIRKINARDKQRQHLSRILQQQQPQNKGQSGPGAPLGDKDPARCGQSKSDMDNLVRHLLAHAKDELWERFKHFRRLVQVPHGAALALLHLQLAARLQVILYLYLSIVGTMPTYFAASDVRKSGTGIFSRGSKSF